MVEPSDPNALAARQLIAKKLAPVELLESCIGLIEAVDHAVNAIVAYHFRVGATTEGRDPCTAAFRFIYTIRAQCYTPR